MRRRAASRQPERRAMVDGPAWPSSSAADIDTPEGVRMRAIGDERFRRSEKRLPRIVPANLAGMTAKGPDAAQKKGENIGRMIVRIESALARAKIYGVLRRPHKGAPERFGVAFNDVAGLANHVWLFG